MRCYCDHSRLRQLAQSVDMERSISKPWISSQSIQLMYYRSVIPVSVNYDSKRATIRHQLRRSLREDREHWCRNRAAAIWVQLMQTVTPVSSPSWSALWVASDWGVSEPIWKSDGAPITDQCQWLQKWAEHFQTTVHLYNSVQLQWRRTRTVCHMVSIWRLTFLERSQNSHQSAWRVMKLSELVTRVTAGTTEIWQRCSCWRS